MLLNGVSFQVDTNYEVLVVAFNAQGESPPSSPITVYVGEAVPTGNPKNVVAAPLSSTEIKISWEVWNIWMNWYFIKSMNWLQGYRIFS